MKKKSTKIKTAVILCGGKGTRLGLLGKKIPKSLIKVQNYPIIWFIIKILKRNSFNHFIIPLGYKGKVIKNYLKNSKDLKNLNIETVDTGVNTSIARRIYKIKNKIKSNDFILLNGDAILDFNIKKMFLEHIKKKREITFLGCEAQLNYGIVGKDKNKIVSFERDTNFNSIKQKSNKTFVGYVYSGIAIMNKKILKVNFKNFINFEKSFYPIIIKKYKANLSFISGFWNSVDNMKDVQDLNNLNDRKKVKQIEQIIKKLKK